MSDARVDDAEYLDAGTHSIAQFRGRGVNDGELGPAHATGRSLDLDFCEILGVEADRIARGDIYYDAMTMRAQFGVIDVPAPA
jgi:ketosteroid isomerase-like protein